MKKGNPLSDTGSGKQRWWSMGLFALVAFVGLFLFFTRVHPLYVFDLDDWMYVYYGRTALPDTMEWNPAKVLPETLMPLIAYIGAYVVYPIQGDYIQSLCYAYGFVVVVTIVGYVLGAAYVVRKRFQHSDGVLAMLSGVFLLGHFVPYLEWELANNHMFYSWDLTCTYNYIVPALLCFLLCCYFATADTKQWWKSENHLCQGLLILAVYLAIHSNLLSNIVLTAYLGIQLLFSLIEGIWESRKEKRKWISVSFLKEFIWTQLPKIAAIVLWLISMIFEVSGERASFSDSSSSFYEKLYETVYYCYWSIRGLNLTFLLSVIFINLAALGIGVYRYRKEKETAFLYWQLEMAATMVLTGIYLVLVCAKVDPEYIGRADVMLSWMIFLMFMTLTALAYLLKVLPKSVLVLPLLLYVLFFEVVTAYSTFADPLVFDQGAVKAKAISDDMVAQILAAEEAGLTEVEVYIPESLANGWPLDVKMTSDRLPKALFHHNLIQSQIRVTIVPTPDKDAQFHLQ